MGEIDLIRQTIVGFCKDFVKTPYLCYTEHGLHALFYTMLYNALPEGQRVAIWRGVKVCLIQKEYPTAENLGKPRRQHWDIAVIKTPFERGEMGPQAYDYLKLAAAIEFGLNEAKDHLIDDIERLSHPNANIAQGFIVHLYRLSKPGALFSNRDWSPNSPRILTPGEVSQFLKGRQVEIYYGMHDSTGKHKPGVWLIQQSIVTPVGGV